MVSARHVVLIPDLDGDHPTRREVLLLADGAGEIPAWVEVLPDHLALHLLCLFFENHIYTHHSRKNNLP